MESLPKKVVLFCDVMFGVFIHVWIVSRFMFYPFE